MANENRLLTREQWAVSAGLLSAATGRPIPTPTMHAYYDLLADIPFDVLAVAIRHAIQSEETTWMPSVGLIRRFAAEAVYGVLPHALSAFTEFQQIYREQSDSDRGNGIGWFEFDKVAFRNRLPEFTRMVYDAIGGSTDEDKFVKTYDRLARVEIEQRKLSPELRPAITANAVAALPVKQLRIAQEESA